MKNGRMKMLFSNKISLYHNCAIHEIVVFFSDIVALKVIYIGVKNYFFMIVANNVHFLLATGLLYAFSIWDFSKPKLCSYIYIVRKSTKLKTVLLETAAVFFLISLQTDLKPFCISLIWCNNLFAVWKFIFQIININNHFLNV